MKGFNHTHSATDLNSKELATLWREFRAIEPRENAWLHLEFCEQIQEKIYHNEPDEAFHLLKEGFRRCYAAEDSRIADGSSTQNKRTNATSNLFPVWHRLVLAFRCLLF